jgi:hypothetical protein
VKANIIRWVKEEGVSVALAANGSEYQAKASKLLDNAVNKILETDRLLPSAKNPPAILGTFLFSGQSVFKKVSSLRIPANRLPAQIHTNWCMRDERARYHKFLIDTGDIRLQRFVIRAACGAVIGQLVCVVAID